MNAGVHPRGAQPPKLGCSRKGGLSLGARTRPRFFPLARRTGGHGEGSIRHEQYVRFDEDASDRCSGSHISRNGCRGSCAHRPANCALVARWCRPRQGPRGQGYGRLQGEALLLPGARGTIACQQETRASYYCWDPRTGRTYLVTVANGLATWTAFSLSGRAGDLDRVFPQRRGTLE
jgi:hypothetical protein